MEKIIQKVDKGYFPEIIQLVDAIEGNDYEQTKDSIKTLINKKAVVKLTFIEKKYNCDSHSFYFPRNPNKFSLNSLTSPICCTYSHKFCNECIYEYVKQKFPSCYLEYSYYQCISCEYYGISGTLILDCQILDSVFLYLFGEQTINNIRNFNQKPIITASANACYGCISTTKPLLPICRALHYTCSECAEKWAMNTTEVKCLVNTCNDDANCNMIIKALEKSRHLSKLKESFKNNGIQINTCPLCMLLLNLNYTNKTTKCECGQEICNNCERPAHFETCFFFESSEIYEEILLTPPKEIGKPKSLREQEYLNAKYAFENFLEDQSGTYYFKSAKLIVNKTLEARYAEKKKKMISECLGEKNIGEVYIWHGSKLENYPKIMNEGLKVGGVDYGVGVDQGNRFGYGIYSSTTPDTPIMYSNNSKFIIACLAMKGIPSTAAIFDIKALNSGLTHSFKPAVSGVEKNWWVFFTKEQVLPRFLVEYGP